METAIERPQRTAARVAGFMYLFLLVTAGLAEFWVRGGIVVPDDAAATVANIAGQERMYRLGVAIDLVAAPANVVLAAALYVLLKPVHRHLARVALLWRVVSGVLLLLACLYTIIVFPDARQVLVPACYAPIGVFELTLGVWLLARPDRLGARA